MRWLLIALVVVASAACTTPPSGPEQPRKGVEVLGTIPHDTSAFTQGLELVDGVLYEGTGLEGQSELRRLDPTTGEVKQQVELPSPLFGEGVTVVGAHIWQITWRDGIAIRRDRETLAEVKRVTYDGEGWGLCRDGGRLVMSDGTEELRFRDPETFDETGRVTVKRNGIPLVRINELECVGGRVWANLWQSDEVVQIDPNSGDVLATVDLSPLRPADVPKSDVLNGIAAVPGTDEFLVTGKNWPTIFRVRFRTG
ncbi:glutamine cyclotransferase [Saccharothrix tamanrassetensis]|uniref:Glutamine cyclotransferase n=1 Tax=Saccharothrix tamanrassetensis TaxID=1051531 RepID=A0A841CDC1_9PSEU|nr:glutaminyl-peptide cyclotransferase [Saccharothrix tamanrassetensis]MBB5956522.1 glutamine cyclotransferase [Saccharothrix tamanrassetensis]